MEMTSCWICGDVHGCLKSLKALLAKLPPDEPKVFTGDLIDRGPDSAGVVDLIMSRGYQCVLGNHEFFMLASVLGGPKFYFYDATYCWRRNGGLETLNSYGFVDGEVDIPVDHLNWMANLPSILEFPELKNKDDRHLVVSHAAVYRKNMASIPLNDPDSVIWNRRLPNYSGEKFFVFGHIPLKKPKITKQYAMIDTGCVYPEGSKLTAIRFPDLTIVTQQRIDKLPGE